LAELLAAVFTDKKEKEKKV